MFKLQRLNKQPFVSKERVDFSFSDFQVLQVPKGWDRLLVSIISAETGKAIAKLSKVLVRNGSCQWPETLLESSWISQDNSSKEITECYFKFVVSNGAAKSGILGEVTLNMVRYMTSGVSASISLPLKRCNYGSIFQVKVQCLTPRTKIRVDQSKYSEFHREDKDLEYHDGGSISNESEDSFAGSIGSSSSQNPGSMSNRGRLDSKARSCSVSSSNHSFDYVEGATGRNNLMSDDASSTSNKLYSDSRALRPRDNLQNNREELALSSLKVAGSSKTLLETAEATIEELRAEAKMWERNARKLMVDLDLLSKEFTDQSKKQADVVMELSAAYAEHEGLKKEIENLKYMLEESKVRKTSTQDLMQPDGASHIQKELEQEIKYQRESNANLALQLKRSQESNIELVTVLQELEVTIEQQRTEIENLSAFCVKLNDKQNSNEEKMQEHPLLKFQQVEESEKKLQMNIQALEKALQEKTSELDNAKYQNSQSVLELEKGYKCKLSLKEEEISRLEAKLSELKTGLLYNLTGSNNCNDVDLVKEVESLREKMQELERDCNELTDENLELLLKLKESNKSNGSRCASFKSTSTELPAQYFSIESQVNDDEAQRHYEEYEENGIADEQLTPYNFSELTKQLEMVSHHIKRPWYSISPDVSEMCKHHLHDLVNVSVNNVTTLYCWTESVVSFLFELNKLLETKITECEVKLKYGELEIQKKDDIIAEDQIKLKNYTLVVQEYEVSKARFGTDHRNLQQELSDVGELKSNLLSKEQENDRLMERERELQSEVADLVEKKKQLEEKMEILSKESDITAKRLDDLQNELSVLGSALDSHVSARKVVEEKLSKMTNEKHELDYQFSELKAENLHLKEQISGLGSHLRHVEAERETCQLELKSSKEVATRLQNDIWRLEIEMDAQKSNLEQNLQDIQKQYLDAQRDCARLKEENQNLESSMVDIIEERNILRKSNAELMQKKLELMQFSARIKENLDESQERVFDYARKVEAIEENLSSTLEAFSSEERRLNLELDALLESNRKDMERLGIDGNLLSQMSSELENLHEEVEHLRKQISMIYEEKERIASEAEDKLSCALSDKARIERDLQKADVKVKSVESKLDKFRVDSEMRLQGLSIELDVVKRSNETLTDEHIKMSKVLANYRTSEEKFKTTNNDLGLKLTVSDYERQQLIEQVTNMKIQLQKLPELQHEVTVLKSELIDCRSEKENLEAALQKISRDHEDLKAEKRLHIQKSTSLEAKILQADGDLKVNADLNNELCKMQRANEQYEQKIHQLEQEKYDYLNRAQALEGKLRLMEEKLTLSEKGGNENFHDGSPQTVEKDHSGKMELFENELSDDVEANNQYKIQLQRFSSEDCMHAIAPKKSIVDGEVVAKEKYERTKSSLEMELRELRERYFEMSLQYAEVEAQREDLVMKLKEAKNAKRWFS